MFTKIRYNWRPIGRTFTLVENACPLTRITATNKVPLREPIPLKVVAQESIVTKVYTRRPKVTKTNGSNSKPKIAKSMISNKTEPGASRGSNNSVASSFCFVDLSLKTKSWLWNRRLSHLNFGAINHLAKNGLVRGLPKLKFEKDHLCSCAMGKSKKQSHKPKSEYTSQKKLYLLHIDLCGPMRVASINGKKYILVIVDDYSQFTWVKFLASNDEAPDFIIKFQKMIQVRLNTPARNIHTDNGTEFVNQTLRSYYESVGISHETSIARSPQQNSIVESEDLSKLQAKADIDIFIGYAPKKKAYCIYNRLANAAIAVDLVDSPVSMLIDQDAPSKSIPSTQDQEHSPIISERFEESPKTPHFHDNPLHESLHEDSTTQGSSSIVRPIHTPFESLVRWNKDHSIANDNPSHVYKLKKALYGLKQAPRAWYDMLSSFLISQHFSKGVVDPTLFTRKAINDLLLAKPTQKHLNAVKRIFRYLKGTINMGLWYLKDTGMSLTAYADTDHARCQDTRRSTSGSAQFLGDKLVSWSFKKQKSTAISST
nr:retrovirus-related Pol polyprotein from transposon TNT 1-94 [Tanacetum cinerariifolium]